MGQTNDDVNDDDELEEFVIPQEKVDVSRKEGHSHVMTLREASELDEIQLSRLENMDPAVVAERVETKVGARMLMEMGRSEITRDTWVSEVRAVTHRAVLRDDIKSAMTGYQMIGRALGVNVDQQKPAENHLHLHPEKHIEEMTAEQIQAQLIELEGEE